MSEAQAQPAERSLADLRGAGKLVAKAAGGNTVAAFFEKNKAAIAAVLPQHMTPERMLKIALRCLRTTPKLMDCTLDSLMAAVITCAQMGLEPNTPQGHIYLIPFKNTKMKRTDVQVIIGYKGLIDLARRSGEIESISSRVVYAKDEFEVDYGLDERIVHRPYMDDDAGPVRGFYAVARLKGSGVQFEFMPAKAVNKIRDGSQGYQQAKRFGGQSPWDTAYEEMGRKTLIRRLVKYLPMSIELAGAVNLDEAADRGTQSLTNVLEGVDYTVQMHEEEPEGEEDTAPQIAQDTTPSVDLGLDKPKPEPAVSSSAEVDAQQQMQQSPAKPSTAAKPTKVTPAPAKNADEQLPLSDDSDGFGSGE